VTRDEQAVLDHAVERANRNAELAALLKDIIWQECGKERYHTLVSHAESQLSRWKSPTP